MEVTSYLLGKKSGGGGDEPTGTIDITSNGVKNVKSYASANVNVQPDLESKSITITENTTTTITPTTGKDGLSSVQVTTNVSGGGSELDWSAIGYSEEPYNDVEDGYNHAVEVKNNWQSSSSLLNKFMNDYKMVYMPLVDTSIATNMASMFRNCYSLKETPQLNTSNVTDMSQMFYACYSFKNVALLNTTNVTNMNSMFFNCYPLEKIPQFDTKNVTNMSSMFGSCNSLEELPLLDTSSVTDMSSMFSGCVSLNDTSLDNILQMCINAVSYAGTKTLKALGFQYSVMTSKYPVSRIQALPHYQDFINAGWTIGY